LLLRWNYWCKITPALTARGGKRRLLFSEIEGMKYETASADEFLAQNRPYRRLVVFGHTQGQKTFIDVSLRHFRKEDIQTLMEEIAKQRPDLSLPSIK
jgi:hypothetical protein